MGLSIPISALSRASDGTLNALHPVCSRRSFFLRRLLRLEGNGYLNSRRDGGRARKNEAGNGSNFQLGKTLANSAEIVLRQTPYAKLINTFMR